MWIGKRTMKQAQRKIYIFNCHHNKDDEKCIHHSDENPTLSCVHVMIVPSTAPPHPTLTHPIALLRCFRNTLLVREIFPPPVNQTT